MRAGVRDHHFPSEFATSPCHHTVGRTILHQDFLDLGLKQNLASVIFNELDEGVADLLGSPFWVVPALGEIANCRHGVINGC